MFCGYICPTASISKPGTVVCNFAGITGRKGGQELLLLQVFFMKHEVLPIPSFVDRRHFRRPTSRPDGDRASVSRLLSHCWKWDPNNSGKYFIAG
jgi:hypothetical protein